MNFSTEQLFDRSPHPQRLHRPSRSPTTQLRRDLRPDEVGPDLGQQLAGANRLRSLAGGQGEAARAASRRATSTKTRAAPVTAIIGMDMAFYEKLPLLFPHADAKSWFVGKKEFADTTAFRNSSLQGGYFIIAARAVGLDCGPMSGFDNAKIDAAFWAGTDGPHATSSATSATATRRSCSRATRACRSTRPAGSNERAVVERLHGPGARVRRRARARRSRSSRRAPGARRPAGARSRTAPRAAGGPAWRRRSGAPRPCGAAPVAASWATLWRRKRSARFLAWCGCQPSSSSALRALISAESSVSRSISVTPSS